MISIEFFIVLSGGILNLTRKCDVNVAKVWWHLKSNCQFFIITEGKILKSGTAEELAADEQVRKVYLGQNFELKKQVLKPRTAETNP